MHRQATTTYDLPQRYPRFVPCVSSALSHCMGSFRSLSKSWTLFQGISFQDIYNVACWGTPHTFVRFYELDVTTPSLEHIVLIVGTLKVDPIQTWLQSI